MTQKFLQEEIKNIINKYDPIGLFKMDCPLNEYDPEINKILPIIQEATSIEALQEKVYAVFVEMFFEDIAGPKENYRKLSENLYSLKR